MDTKRLILSVAIMMLVVTAWEMGVSYLNKQHPEWGLLKPTPDSTTQPTTQSDTSTPNARLGLQSSIAATNPTTSTSVVGGLHVASDASSLPTELGSTTPGDPAYAMNLRIDPAGAGLSSATLNDFYDTAEKKNLYAFQQPIPGLDSTTRPLATRSISINGIVVDLSNVNWAKISSDSTSVTYAAIVDEAGTPDIEIDKTFRVQPRKSSDGSAGFEVNVSQAFKNLSSKSLEIKTTFNGPTLPPSESDRSEDRQFVAGYDDEKDVAVTHTPLSDFARGKPSKDLASLDKRPLLWVGAGSAYFNAIVRPEYAGQSANPKIKIASVPINGANVDAPAGQQSAEMTIQTNEFKLDPAASESLNLKLFLGPRQRALLKNEYYSRFPLSYDRTMVTSGGYCGFLTFQPLINLLYGILWFFHMIFRDWGIAIIGLVVLVRTLLHPITKKSQVNMLQMGKMGPEIERLKKKHGDNKDELNKAMMQFYKTQGFTPILGCLPMFLQMPIWIALWSRLQSTFELRQAPFLRFGWLHLTWIKDLSHPDFLVRFNQPISLFFGFTLHGINVLPILLAGMFYLQQKFQPQPANQSPEQAQQRKMMQWMSLLFPVMLYAGPSGLNLYILTSTAIGVIESKIIRDHIKARDDAEKAGRIIVDAKPTRAGKKLRDDDEFGGGKRNGGGSRKPTGVMGWLANLQAKAEEIRRDADRKKG